MEYDELLKVLRSRYRGRKALRARRVLRYPRASEREYRRLLRRYYAFIGASLDKYLDRIISLYKTGLMADRNEALRRIRDLVLLCNVDHERRLKDFDIRWQIRTVADGTRRRAIREWHDMVAFLFSVGLMDDYYWDMQNDNVGRWVAENINYVVGVPSMLLQRVNEYAEAGYRNNINPDDLKTMILDEKKRLVNKADLFACNQTGNLSSKLYQTQMEDAGITHYIWRTVGDDRVRECHAMLDGTLQSLDNPPQMWYMTKAGRVNTGFAHPGEDYNCRCAMEPVFNLDKVKLVIAEKYKI